VDAGRPNQKRRTRKALLDAAAQLAKAGRKPSLDEVAEAALVSRATAYRYFPNVEALLLEAGLELSAQGPEALFGPDAPSDAAARVERVDAMLHDMTVAHEPALRLMLASAHERAARGELPADVPSRQDRRTPLIEAALAPALDQFDPEAVATLVSALGLIVGPEGFLAGKDVLRLSDAQIRAVRRWAIRALVAAARRPA
jgi:AcrR family transcriptional regulator